jgi:hypothetical protein
MIYFAHEEEIQAAASNHPNILMLIVGLTCIATGVLLTIRLRSKSSKHTNKKDIIPPA